MHGDSGLSFQGRCASKWVRPVCRLGRKSLPRPRPGGPERQPVSGGSGRPLSARHGQRSSTARLLRLGGVCSPLRCAAGQQPLGSASGGGGGKAGTALRCPLSQGLYK